MQELVNKLSELVALFQAKYAELTDKLAATQKVAMQQADVAQALLDKAKDLDVRQIEINKAGNLISLAAKVDADTKALNAGLAELAVQREGHRVYLETSNHDIAQGKAEVAEKRAGIDSDKAALELARTNFLEEVRTTRKQMAEDKEAIDIERKKVIAAMGK